MPFIAIISCDLISFVSDVNSLAFFVNIAKKIVLRNWKVESSPFPRYGWLNSNMKKRTILRYQCSLFPG